jgi:eukaryotic-like serine/threonine-protein kinase
MAALGCPGAFAFSTAVGYTPRVGVNEAPPTTIGRYLLSSEIASGGMATVFLGRVTGAVGFSRIVAIKRLHPFLAKEPGFVSMFVDEARMAARIHHAHVVPTLDVIAEGTDLCLVMEYVNGDSLASLLRRADAKREPLPLDIALAIASGALHGLHAAHEAKNERGEPLNIVHRDVSPQNILIGADGVTRVFDFGVAKATGRLQTTADGSVKGKCAYMAPEQLQSKAVDRRADIFALGVVLWECLTNERLFAGDTPAASVTKVLHSVVQRPSMRRPEVPADLDAIVMQALDRSADRRFATARDMALAIEACSVTHASSTRVSGWINTYAADSIAIRNAAVAALEDSSGLRGTPAQAPTSADQVAAARTMTSVAMDAGAPPGRAHLVPSAPADAEPAAPAPIRAPDRRGRVVVIALGVALLAGAGTVIARTQSKAPATTVVAAPSPPSSSSEQPSAPITSATASAASSVVTASPSASSPTSTSLGTRATSRAALPPPRKPTARPSASAPSDKDVYGLSH